MSKENKKCKPLNCKYFFKRFEAAWDKRIPVDVFVVKCPFRKGTLCTNDNEELDKVYIA